MSLLIGVPEGGLSGREAGRHRAGGRREADQAGLPRRRRDAAPATRAQLQRRRLPRRRRRDRRRRRAELWATSDIVFKVRAAERRRSRRCCAKAATLVGFIWPAQNPELMQQLAARKATVLAIDSAAAPALARAEDGRADLDGRRQRLPRRHRGGQRVRPLLQRPDHGRGQGAAGQGVHRRRRRRGPRGDRHRRRTWARSCAPTTRAPRSPTRSSRWAASSSRSTTRRRAPAAAATPR